MAQHPPDDKGKKRKKRILTKIGIGEISAVDQPAQEGAVMAIMKSAGNPGELKETELPNAGDGFTKEKGNMPKTVEELTAELKTSADMVDKLQKTLDRNDAILSMSSEVKAHFDGLKKGAKDKFLALSEDDQAEEVEEIRKNFDQSDPVIYKSVAGVEYRESEKSLAALAKQADVNAKDLHQAREDSELLRLEKRVKEEIPHLKGDDETKARLLKAVGDDKDVLETLKAADKAVAEFFKTKGSDGLDGGEGGDETPEDKLDKLAEKKADKDSITFAKAYTAVLETSEGAELYNQALSH